MNKLVCPKCGNYRFVVTAHVTETWEVDENGYFVDILPPNDEQVVVRPRLGGDFRFVCRKCDTEAVEVPRD